MNSRLLLPIVFAFAFTNFVMPVEAQVVPGSGQQIVEVFDDFEDPEWNFTLNLPKASSNIDKVERHPAGFSANRLYLESMYRGTPDFVRRIETPAGGISGSKGALAMQTLHSGVPGQFSHKFQQDDLIAGMQQKLGYMIPVSWTPSYTCRVYIPPFEKWERRHGSHFGFRADCTTTITKTASVGRLFRNMGSTRKLEQYWPGFFIQLNLKGQSGQKEDSATLLIRADHLGHEVPGPAITRPGWWTLGMSFTPDGRVHYYAHEGVADLTARDHLHSGFPYGYKCEQTSTFFFNIVNQDDGRSWSTRWIVDDPKAYVASGSYRPTAPQVVQKPAVPAQAAAAAAVAPAVPAAKPAIPAAVPATLTAVPVVLARPVVATVPVQPGTPAAVPTVVGPQVPQLASKPTEVPIVIPKIETTVEAPKPLPVTPPEIVVESPPAVPVAVSPPTPVEPSTVTPPPAETPALVEPPVTEPALTPPVGDAPPAPPAPSSPE